MRFDISSITNEALRQLATDVDNGEKGNKNGILEDDEISIWTDEAHAQGISAEDIQDVYNAQTKEAPETPVADGTTETAQAPETVTFSGKKVDASKTSKKHRNEIKDDIETYVNAGYKPEELMSKLSTKYSNNDYKAALDAVQIILNAVKATNFQSKDDVENIKKTVKSNLDLDGFGKDVLSLLVKQAKAAQIAKEVAVIQGIYKKETEKSQTVNFSKALESTKAEMKNQGLWGTSYYSDDALEEFEKALKKEADGYADQQIYKAHGTTEKEVRKERLNDVAEGDKILEKTIKKDDFDNEMYAKINKFLENKEKLQHATEKDLKKVLGNKLFNKLNRNYLPSRKNADGTYDVSDLAEMMKEQAGADLTINRSDNTYIAEREQTKSAIREIANLDGKEVKNNDLKKIAKLTAVDYDKRSYNPIKNTGKLLSNAGNLITSGIAAAAAVFATGKININNHAQIDLVIEGASEDVLKQLEVAGATVQRLDDKLKVRVISDQNVVKNASFMKLLIGAGAGVLQAALIQLIFGDDVQFERSCLSLTDIKTNDLDEYRKHLEKLYVKEPSKVDAIIGLAATYKTEDGQWDAEAYKKDLESYAGKGTNMNCKEFRSVKLWKIKDAHNPSDKEPVKTPTETTEDVGSYATREVCTDVIEDVPTIDGRSTTWSQIAAQYDCLRTTAFKDIVPNQTPLNKAIRALKIAQAITNGDYSYENISRLVEMSYKNPSGMKNVEGLDYNVYSNTLKATVLGKDVKVPNTLADCQRNTNVSLKVTNPVKKATKTVTQNGSAKDRIKTGENCSYDARMGGETSSYATRTERDNAVNEYKKTHQKAKQETW